MSIPVHYFSTASFEAGSEMRLSVLIAIMSFLIGTPLLTESPPINGRSLDVILLLDRSDYFNGGHNDGSLVDAFGKNIASESVAFAHSHKLDLRLSAANFGKIVGNSFPFTSTSTLNSAALPALPGKEEIPLKDYTAPLAFALKQVRAPSRADSIRVVFLVTDGSPRLSSKPMTRGQKETYFGEQGSKEAASLQNYLQALKSERASVVFVALTHDNTFESFWRSVLPQGNYIPALDKPALVKEMFAQVYSKKYISLPNIGAPTLHHKAAKSGSWPRPNNARPLYIFAAAVFTLAGVILFIFFFRLLRISRFDHARRKAVALAARGKKKLAQATLAAELSRADEEAERTASEAENQRISRRRTLRGLIEASLALAASDDPNAAAKVLVAQLSDNASLEKIEATGLLLLERWTKKRSRFDLEFSQLRSAPKRKVLLEYFVNLDTDQHWSDEQINFLASLKRYADDCLRLPLAFSFWKERPEESLRRYRLSLAAVMGDSNADDDSLEIFDLLEDFLLQRPLHRLYTRESIEATSPAYLRPFLAEVFPLFPTQLCLSDDPEELKALIAVTCRPVWSELLEAEFLRVAAEGRLKELSLVFPVRTLLTISISPSLDYNSLEPEFTAEETGASAYFITISIINTERIAAWSPELLVEDSGAVISTELIDGLPRVEGEPLVVAPKLAGGEAIVVRILVRHTSSAPELKLYAEYNRTVPTPDRERSNTIVLQLVNSPRSVDDRTTTPSNPYYPDLPLYTDDQWASMANRSQRTIAEQILADPELARGRTSVVLGLRRTGKTSLLLELVRRMEESNSLLPVYIDIYRWHSSLVRTKAALDDENLYYEIAEAAIHAANKCLILLGEAEQKAFEDCFRSSFSLQSENLRLTSDALGFKLRHLQQCLSKKIVIILDELDWWLNKGPFEDGQRILSPLVSLASRSKDLSLLLAYDWVSPDWFNLFNQYDLTLVSRRLNFGHRSELKSLLSLSGLTFSLSAEEFIWRFTGGWTGVLDLVAFAITDRFGGNRDGAQVIIDLPAARAVVKYLVESPEYFNFFSTFQEGLTRDEVELLGSMAASGLIEEKSGLIRYLRLTMETGLQFDPPRASNLDGKSISEVKVILLELQNKEVIEVIEGSFGLCRLRAGFLFYACQRIGYRTDGQTNIVKS